jgi:hypothetical protein
MPFAIDASAIKTVAKMPKRARVMSKRRVYDTILFMAV